MTGHRSDETHDQAQEYHSDAESLRHIPNDYEDRGVVQDSPGTHDIGVEHGNPNRQKADEDDDTNGRTLDDDLTARG
ncbi:hypothetical protein HNQ07_001711 [Deinococcus metalli]|uniref:Uncharacterized protein n=1 Tax=Deinococcus metalli TaxID=1141878 RepID=A0A7W8KDN2_9DEIO|nr:hypothetical protein [Deinococcus metalli]MBB5376254.1 hypothetical protein [Deinococcus metalli]GHF39676.1 hypothetical protein GCM10017781_15280 [Deinococcus metalli]